MEFIKCFLFFWFIFPPPGSGSGSTTLVAVWRIRDVYPGSWFLPIPDPGSRIPDPKTVTKERGEKKICHTFFCSHKFHKIEYYVIFEMLKKKIWANFQRIVEVLTQKIFNMLSNIWVWDPGSGIRDPGSGKNLSRIQGSKRHRIPDPDPQQCLVATFALTIRHANPSTRSRIVQNIWDAILRARGHEKT